MSSIADRVAAAPISWGVCEVPGWGAMLPVDRVLAEMQALGIRATELGPEGYLPTDPQERQQLLTSNGLSLVGGFVPAVLHRPERAPVELAAAADAIRGLHAAGAAVAVVAAVTGGDGYEGGAHLDEAGWTALVSGLAQLRQLTDELGMTLSLHPHVGTMVLSEEDVATLLDRSPVGLCLDTGHLAIGGADVLGLTKRFADRIAHVHLKDVDLALAHRVARGELGYEDGVRSGLYRPLGEGDVSIGEIVQQLEQVGYDGWYVLEQDVAFDADPGLPGPAADVEQSLRFLLSLEGR